MSKEPNNFVPGPQSSHPDNFNRHYHVEFWNLIIFDNVFIKTFVSYEVYLYKYFIRLSWFALIDELIDSFKFFNLGGIEA